MIENNNQIKEDIALYMTIEIEPKLDALKNIYLRSEINHPVIEETRPVFKKYMKLRQQFLPKEWGNGCIDRWKFL